MSFEKVRDILVEQLDVEENEIKPESNIQEDLEADSLDIVEIVMEIEDEFDIKIPESEIEKIKTVKDIVDYIATANN